MSHAVIFNYNATLVQVIFTLSKQSNRVVYRKQSQFMLKVNLHRYEKEVFVSLITREFQIIQVIQTSNYVHTLRPCILAAFTWCLMLLLRVSCSVSVGYYVYHVDFKCFSTAVNYLT